MTARPRPPSSEYPHPTVAAFPGLRAVARLLCLNTSFRSSSLVALLCFVTVQVEVLFLKGGLWEQHAAPATFLRLCGPLPPGSDVMPIIFVNQGQ